MPNSNATPTTDQPAAKSPRGPSTIVLTDQYAVSYHKDVTVRPDLEAVIVKWAAQNNLDVQTEARRHRTPKEGAKPRVGGPTYHPITVVPHGWTKPVAATSQKASIVATLTALPKDASAADALAALRAAGIIN
jgi:hypothetical protein